MKQLLLIATFLVAGIVNAQVEVASYKTSYWPEKEKYKIEVSDEKGEIDKIWIEAPTLDKTSREGYIIIDAKKLPDFIEYLKLGKSKYEEWSKTAKENNVTELNKEIEPAKRFNTTAAFKYGKWQYDFSNNLTAKFLILKDKTLLTISTGNLQSSSNQFMKNEGVILVFSDADEIQQFIDQLDLAKFTELIKSKDKKEDLFK